MAEPARRDKGQGMAGAGHNRTAYDADLYTWVQEQVALLRAGELAALDLQNIAEELSDVGRAQYHQLESALRVLLMHMLKWDRQPEHRTPSWIYSIREQRRRYERILAQNPGLKPRLEEARDAAYPNARDWAADETHLTPDEFPDACPYDWNDILGRPFDLDSVKR
jgi:predicted DNA-binding ribbon-helix-helix protein